MFAISPPKRKNLQALSVAPPLGLGLLFLAACSTAGPKKQLFSDTEHRVIAQHCLHIPQKNNLKEEQYTGRVQYSIVKLTLFAKN